MAGSITGCTKIVASLKPKGKRFVICPQFTRGDEIKGTEGWQRIHAINAAFKNYWPGNYCEIDGVDLLQNFKNHFNPDNETDVKISPMTPHRHH